jgi:zinc transporter ZupT
MLGFAAGVMLAASARCPTSTGSSGATAGPRGRARPARGGLSVFHPFGLALAAGAKLFVVSHEMLYNAFA